jgi:imidazolonepropionase-like amidohydrolase
MAVHGSSTLHGAFTFPHEQAIFHSAGTLRGILSNGFTTVRDTGGATIAHAKATAEFLIPGPRVFQGGRMLSQTGGHGDGTIVWSEGSGPAGGCCSGSHIGPSALGRICDGVDECTKAARDNMRKGANHLKVCTSGGIASDTDPIDSIQFSIEELRAITSVCSAMKGTLVTAHCYTAEGIEHALAGGVRGIEHGNMLTPSVARDMAAVGAFLTPTLALHTFVTMPPYDKFETPEGLRKNAIVAAAGVRAIRYAEDAGVCVCFGTDTTGPTLVMQTYEFVVRGKILDSKTVLRQATINGAKQLGMEGLLGELVPGAFADLLFLKEDPLEDIASLDRKRGNLCLIMKDGRVVKSMLADVQVERACEWNS